MPFRKKWSKKRYGSKVSKKTSKAIKKVVKKELAKEIETKYLDTINTFTATYDPSLLLLSAVPQGITETERVGISIVPMSLSMNLTVFGPTGFGYDGLRCIVLQWHPDSGQFSGPTITQILSVTSSSNTVNSEYEWQLRDQFTILYDKRWRMDESTYQTDNSFRLIKKRIKLRKKITFDGSTTNASNNIYVAFISNLASSGSLIEYYFRLTYKDA